MKLSLKLIRCTSAAPEFVALCHALDAELHATYADLQNTYDEFNQIVDVPNVVVGFTEDVPVACGCFRIIDTETVELKRMFVCSDKRGLGYSKLILGELESWAMELGYSLAVLETGNEQHAAIHLYQSCGFSQIENYGPYKGLETSLCMSKPLVRQVPGA